MDQAPLPAPARFMQGNYTEYFSPDISFQRSLELEIYWIERRGYILLRTNQKFLYEVFNPNKSIKFDFLLLAAAYSMRQMENVQVMSPKRVSVSVRRAQKLGEKWLLDRASTTKDLLLRCTEEELHEVLYSNDWSLMQMEMERKYIQPLKTNLEVFIPFSFVISVEVMQDAQGGQQGGQNEADDEGGFHGTTKRRRTRSL